MFVNIFHHTILDQNMTKETSFSEVHMFHNGVHFKTRRYFKWIQPLKYKDTCFNIYDIKAAV